MKTDPKLQREILEKLKDVFPNSLEINELSSDNENIKNLIANLYYLKEHGLLEMSILPTFGGKIPTVIKITAKGIDFIEDDGGLSEILNTITIKIHPDTIRKLLINKINGKNISDDEKSKFIEYIKTIPETAMNSVISKLISIGIENIPNACTLISLLKDCAS